MANFNQEQADAAVESCSIHRYKLKSDATKGRTEIAFASSVGESYQFDWAETDIAMDATRETIEVFLKNFLKNSCEYLPAPGTDKAPETI